jgi:hypothetical protein
MEVACFLGRILSSRGRLQGGGARATSGTNACGDDWLTAVDAHDECPMPDQRKRSAALLGVGGVPTNFPYEALSGSSQDGVEGIWIIWWINP